MKRARFTVWRQLVLVVLSVALMATGIGLVPGQAQAAAPWQAPPAKELFGRRVTSASDAPLAAVTFARDGEFRDCLVDNSCPDQVGNDDDDEDDDEPAATPTPIPTPTRDPYSDARQSRDAALASLRAELSKPSWIVYPAVDRQVVNLDSFLHITDGYEAKSETGPTVGSQRVTVHATPQKSIWQFTEGTTGAATTIECVRTEPWTAGDEDPLCGKEWEHSSDVIGNVDLQVGIEYLISWNHTYTSGSYTQIVWAPNGGSLLVNEVQAWGIGSEFAYEPEPGAVPEVVPAEPPPQEKIDCGWGAKWAAAVIPGVGCEPIQLVWDLFTGFLGRCVGAIIGRIGDFADLIKGMANPVTFVKEKVAGLKAMYDLIMEDPKGAVETLGRGFFEIPPDADLDSWDAGDWADWAGGFVCGVAFDYLTGAAVAKVAKIVDRLTPGRRPGDGGDGDPDRPNPTCRNSSFPAETPVLMADGGYLAIEAIRPGDRVMSYDLDTSVWEPKLVLDQWSHLDRGPPATLTLADGSMATATDDHRFWVASDSAWTELRDVTAGDRLLSPSGEVAVDHVTVGPAHPWTVWELTVADNHNFAISTGTTDLLVHNEDREHTPTTHPDEFEPVRGTKAKKNKRTGEIWYPDLLHKDHWEVYKNKKQFENGNRLRAVWDDGRIKQCF